MNMYYFPPKLSNQDSTLVPRVSVLERFVCSSKNRSYDTYIYNKYIGGCIPHIPTSYEYVHSFVSPQMNESLSLHTLIVVVFCVSKMMKGFHTISCIWYEAFLAE